MDFKLVSDYKPTGDQPKAIDSLVRGIEMGLDDQVLLGVTGSGKTFTMANVIAKLNRPTLVLAHNKRSPRSCARSSASFSRKTLSSILSLTTTTISPRHTSPTRTRISKRIPPSMMKSSACATRRPRLLPSAGT